MPTASPVREHVHLPQPWLCQLIKASDPSSRMALARTCKELWNLVLFNSNEVAVKLNPYQDQQGVRSATCLQLLNGCREDGVVRLVVRAWPYAHPPTHKRVRREDEITEDWRQAFDSEDNATSANTFWLEGFCERLLAAAGSASQCITQLELQGAVLGNLVPTCVIRAFPRLQHLTRPASLYRVPGRLFSPNVCPQLYSLTLTGSLTDWYDEGIDAAQLKQQLRALPNLQTLSVWDDGGIYFDYILDESSGIPSHWIQGITELCGQLTTLDLEHCDTLDGSELMLLLQDRSWPLLKRLACPGYESVGVENLLKYAPNLQELVVYKFQVADASFASRCCSWGHVSIRGCPDLAALAALPLSGLQTLSIDDILVNTSQLHLASVVAEKLARIGSINRINGLAPFTVKVCGQAEPAVGIDLQGFVSAMVQCLASLRQQKVMVKIHRHWNDLLMSLGGVDVLQAQLAEAACAVGVQQLSLEHMRDWFYDPAS